jgi:hypothetical protein
MKVVKLTPELGGKSEIHLYKETNIEGMNAEIQDVSKFSNKLTLLTKEREQNVYKYNSKSTLDEL